MFGKYQCTIERVLNPDDTVKYIPVNDTLETLAENYLVQYVKHATHPKHDDDLELQLLDIKNGSQLMQYYCTNWAKDGDFQEGKISAEPIIIPRNVKPNQDILMDSDTEEVAGTEMEDDATVRSKEGYNKDNEQNDDVNSIDFQQGQQMFP